MVGTLSARRGRIRWGAKKRANREIMAEHPFVSDSRRPLRKVGRENHRPKLTTCDVKRSDKKKNSGER